MAETQIQLMVLWVLESNWCLPGLPGSGIKLGDMQRMKNGCKGIDPAKESKGNFHPELPVTLSEKIEAGHFK